MEKILRRYVRPGSVFLESGAKYGLLPEKLNPQQIARLYFPEKEATTDRVAIIAALQAAIKSGELKAETIEHRQLVQTSMLWVDGSKINPDIEDKYQTFRSFRIHRDDYRAFLEANGEWPPAADSPVAAWFAEVSGNESPPEKQPVPRENEMHVLLERAFLLLRDELGRAPSMKEVWRALQERADTLDTDHILYKIDGDTIEWRSMAGHTSVMRFDSAANRLSKIRRKFSGKNHR